MVEVQLAFLGILVLLSAFFSGIETALMSITLAKVKSLVKQGKRGSEALYRIKQNPHRLLITILVGNNLVNISSAALATIVFTDLFGDVGVGVATGVMTFLILVFGEITPKTFATQNAERISLRVARPIELLSIILSPVVRIFEGIARGMAWILGSKKEKSLSEEELKTIVTMGKEEGIISREAARMMHNVLEFEGTEAREIMTPKSDVQILDGNKKLKDVLSFVVKSPYSRFPVYQGSPNKIIGVLDVDLVLKYVKNKRLDSKVKSMIQPAYFVPESKEIVDLLTEFEGRKQPLAVVVNEYGDVVGLVTIEDILEEIVGNIFDKSKRESVYIKQVSDKEVRVNAKASLEEVNRILHLGLKEDQFNTIAGFVQHRLQRIPKRGEKVELKNVSIIVERVTDQGIKRVRIVKK